MKYEKLELFEKGTYKPIKQNFLTEGFDVLQKLQKVQKKFEKKDTDTFINELRDSIVGYYLGFDLVNIEKHGFDCMMSSGQNKKLGEYLEEKIKWFKSGHTVRSTQSLALSKIVFDYKFKILTINRTKEETLNILRLKNKYFNKMTKDNIIEISDFKGLNIQ